MFALQPAWHQISAAGGVCAAAGVDGRNVLYITAAGLVSTVAGDDGGMAYVSFNVLSSLVGGQLGVARWLVSFFAALFSLATACDFSF